MHIDHVNIRAPMVLLREVRDFYCKVLGFTEGFRPNFSEDGFWLYSQGKALIHLVENPRSFVNNNQGNLDHFALLTTGVEEVLERLKEYNIEYRTSFVSELGLTQIFCKDPSGTGVELSFQNESITDQ